MSDSERTAWAKAFVAAQAEFPAIHKGRTAEIPTKTGGKYSYSYADLTDVLAGVRPVLAKHGLSLGQSVAGDSREVAVTTRIYHSDGWVEEFGPVVLPAGGDARSAGSAITYARRYGLTAALGISTEDDDDGAQASKPQRQSKPKDDPSQIARQLSNRLKKKAMEVAGDKDKAAELYDRVVGDTAVTLETVQALEEALSS